jgi:hypothetical protein
LITASVFESKKCVRSATKDMRIFSWGRALIPGSTFGAEGCQLRLAYGALDRDSVAQGVGRLVRGLRAIIKRP